MLSVSRQPPSLRLHSRILPVDRRGGSTDVETLTLYDRRLSPTAAMGIYQVATHFLQPMLSEHTRRTACFVSLPWCVHRCGMPAAVASMRGSRYCRACFALR